MRNDTILPPEPDEPVEAEVEWVEEHEPPGLGCGALLVEAVASMAIGLVLFGVLVAVVFLLG